MLKFASVARLSVAALLIAALVGCTAGGSLVPIKAVGTAAGDLSGPQVFLAGQAMNALVKVHGNFAYTIQPFPPYLTYDGDWTIIVEPSPGKENEAIAAVTRGDILIRRDGQPSALNAPGTIAAYKAALMAMPKPESKPPPPPPPPADKPPQKTEPKSTASADVSETPTVCVGDNCGVPIPHR